MFEKIKGSKPCSYFENGNYLVKEVDLDKIYAEIPCSDSKKEAKLLDCLYELRS
jgi:hypothetical protein